MLVLALQVSRSCIELDVKRMRDKAVSSLRKIMIQAAHLMGKRRIASVARLPERATTP
jgi:hypothetical protein